MGQGQACFFIWFSCAWSLWLAFVLVWNILCRFVIAVVDFGTIPYWLCNAPIIYIYVIALSMEKTLYWRRYMGILIIIGYHEFGYS